MARRGLRPEEEALWREVVQSLRPLPRQGLVLPQMAPIPPSLPEEKPPPVPLAPFQLGQAAPLRGPDWALTPPPAPLRMDAKAYGRMLRGKATPEARIDLHGMTLAEAHPALISFVLGAAGRGQRLLLVITGKGRAREDHGPIPQRAGALRQALPGWLNAPPLGPLVLQMAEAHGRHGGGGAFYVYLKRGLKAG